MADITDKAELCTSLRFTQYRFGRNYAAIRQGDALSIGEVAAHRAVGDTKFFGTLGHEGATALIGKGEAKAPFAAMLYGEGRDGEILGVKDFARFDQGKGNAHLWHLVGAKDDIHQAIDA